MWRFFLLFTLFSLGTASAAAVPPVQDVDFYPSGARFIFKIEANKDFEFTLPGTFDIESIRPLSQKEVDSFRVEAVLREDWVPPSLESLKLKIEDETRNLSLLNGRKTALQQTAVLLNAPLPSDFSGKELAFFIEDAQAIRYRTETEMVDLKIEIEKHQRDLGRMQAEFNRRMPDNSGTVLNITGTAKNSGSFLVEAYTTAAGWGVFYKMNLNTSTGKIQALMHSQTWQRTGIDINGNLTFHTREPNLTVAAPHLLPVIVGLAPKHPEQRALYDNAQMAYAPAPLPKLAEAKPERARAPEPIVTLVNTSIKAPGKIDGDGTPSDIPLGELELSSTPVLVAIPAQRQEAWIVASMDSAPASLLPGKAELSVDGSSTGNIFIPEYGSGQLFLPFGMASRLSATKERLIGKTGTTWTGKGVLRDGYTITLRNGFDVEKTVTVKDLLPVPANDRIVLEVDRITPEPMQRDENGILTWKMTLKPDETQKITVEYVLRYPGDETLIFE